MKLKRTLEMLEGRDELGWTINYKIDGAKVSRDIFQREKNRVCLRKIESDSFSRGYAHGGSNEPQSVLDKHKTIMQYFPLPFYLKRF
ncbi:hypothetical protein HYT23_04200 [Candidatus Pacearchaeota archaeon]|nr:hypothetical protein [Candidatus Pacearchaeota archaeon]